MSVADVQVIEWCLTMGKQQGSIESPPVKELQVVLLEVLNSSEEDFTCSHVCYSFGKTKARITPRLRQESFPLAGDAGFRHCRKVVYQNRCFRARGVQLLKYVILTAWCHCHGITDLVK